MMRERRGCALQRTSPNNQEVLPLRLYIRERLDTAHSRSSQSQYTICQPHGLQQHGIAAAPLPQHPVHTDIVPTADANSQPAIGHGSSLDPSQNESSLA